jgi:DNA repair exonuclease SbcCD ATPase subunit
MAAESEEDQLSVQLPPDLEAWLDEQASEQGVERERLLQRLLEASRLVIAEAGTDPDVDLGDLSDRVETLDDEVDALAADLDALDAIDERIEEMRKRVIQVKRETDAKAPADHDHDEFGEIEGRIGELADAVSEIRTNVEELRGAVDSYDEQVESVTDRLHQVAAAIVGLRKTVEEFERDERLMDLKSTAARRGFQKAYCSGCGRTINLAVLTAAACPHCEMPFHDVAGNSGFLSTPTLVGEDEA